MEKALLGNQAGLFCGIEQACYSNDKMQLFKGS
jgi:hypothetical protein